MTVFQMVTIITVVAIFGGLVREWIKKQSAPQVDLSGIESRLDTIERLEERVRILEAIVTDKSYGLRDEINNLK